MSREVIGRRRLCSFGTGGVNRSRSAAPSSDYVVVGAGSAGCVLANRLSEDPGVSVTVVEAGGRGLHPNIAIPAAFAKQFHTKLDWDHATEPEPHCGGRSLYLPRGKGLGGSSGMNAMLYVRGRPLDYDLWRTPGWRWDDVRPYFLRSEDNARGASEHHGAGGPLRVVDERSPRPLTKRFLQAAERAGIPYVADYNGPEQDGAALAQVTQRNGRRCSANDAYLRPVRGRPNLAIVTGAAVQGLTLEGGRATGVRYRGRFARQRVLRADREVILAAGAFGSPQLLMLSGVGPADHLRALGIEVRARGRAEPAGPSVPDLRLRSRERLPLRRRASALPGRVAAATQRPADLDGRGGVRLRAQSPGPAGARPAVPLRARLLRRPRRGHLRGSRDDLRPGADHTAKPRQARAALRRGRRAAAHPRGGARRRGQARARDRRVRAAAVEREARAVPGGGRAGGRRSGGGPSAAREPALPRRHLPHGDGPHGGPRRRAARAGPRGAAGHRRVDHAAHPRREHERRHDHDRRAWSRPHPRSGRGGQGSFVGSNLRLDVGLPNDKELRFGNDGRLRTVRGLLMGRARGHLEGRLWEARPGGMGGRRHRRAFNYEAFVPETVADWDIELRADAVAAVTEASSSVEHLNQSPPKLQSLEALARQLLRSESLASSRIEGLDLSHRRLARAAFAGSEAHDAKASDVIGNIAAMERAIEIGAAADPFTITDIKTIHEALLRFGLDKHIAGVIRTKQNWISRNVHTPENADFVPPPPELVEGLLEDLCAFMNRSDLPALVQAAVVHAQFETIHPFADGNGRVGRCLIHAVIKRRGTAPRYVPPISIILATRREQYIQGLTDFRDGRTDEWVEAFSDATKFAAREAERFADEIAALQERWAESLGQPRRDSAASKVLAVLPAYPVIDIATAQSIAGVSDVAAGRALNAMEETGILTNLGERQRDRTWECRALFDLVNDFERDLATAPVDDTPAS